MIDFLIADKAAEMMKNEKFPRFLYKKGITAEGFFSAYMELSEFTTAEPLLNTSIDVPVTVRFSKVFGESGTSDTARDVISMAVRFFTKVGHWDMIAHNIVLPEAVKTPTGLLEVIDLFKKTSDKACEKYDGILSSIKANGSLTPIVVDYYSDITTVKSYAGIDGYVLNEYVLTNAEGVSNDAIFRWLPENGAYGIRSSEAEFLAGYEPNIALIDMRERIKRKKYPKFLLEAEINGKKLICGHMRLEKIAKEAVNDEIQFTPSNTISGIKLKDTDFNMLTAFMFNESIRLRGGIK